MRAFVVRDFQLDDAMVVVALVYDEDSLETYQNISNIVWSQFMVNGFSALSYTITYYGLGRHQDAVSIPDLMVFLKVSQSCILPYD